MLYSVRFLQSTTLLECKIGQSTTLLECKIGPSTTILSFTKEKPCVDCKIYYGKSINVPCWNDQSATTVAGWPYGWQCIGGKICNGNFITGPY